MNWTDIQNIDSPGNYPVGRIEQDFEDEVREYLNSYNLNEMKYEEIRELLFKIRQDLQLKPWHPVTPYLQAFAFGDWEARGKHLKGNPVSWISCTGNYRPLSMYTHDITESYPVYASIGSGEQIYVGDLIMQMDGKKCFRFWGIYTERMIEDCSSYGRPIRDPRTGEQYFTSTVLCTWKERVTLQGDVVVKVLSRRHRLSAVRPNGEPKSKPKDEQPELPLKSTDPVPVKSAPAKMSTVMCLSGSDVEKRRYLIEMFICMSSLAKGTVVSHEKMTGVLTEYLRVLDGPSASIQIPDIVLMTCWSFYCMMPDDESRKTTKYWYDALVRTEDTRVTLEGTRVP